MSLKQKQVEKKRCRVPQLLIEIYSMTKNSNKQNKKMSMKKELFSMLALLMAAVPGAWADDDPDPIDLSPSADKKVWTLASMPEYDVELEVTYYTDEELTDMAVNAINALPLASNVSTNNEAAIEAARAYYNALSDNANFPAESLAKLVADEVALAIVELPAPNAVTESDKTAILAARAAYNALSDDQKTAVGTVYKAKLEADLVALVIAALPAPNAVTANDRPRIEAARLAYDELSAAQKTAVGDAAKEKLQADEVALAIADLPLPTSVTIANKDAIIAARTAYNNLTSAQKAAVGDAALATLVEAEEALCFKVNVPAGGYVTFITDQPLCAYSETSPVAELYTVSNVAGTTVTLSSAIDTASVNTPLLIHNTADTNETLYLMPCKTPTASTTSYAGYKGTAVDKAQGADGNGPWNFAANTKYYGFDGQNFVRIVAAGSVAANRCWIELAGNSGARQLTIVRGETTGVAGVKDVNAVSDENWYDLQGRKVQGKPARKGLYLQNGQKIIIK